MPGFLTTAVHWQPQLGQQAALVTAADDINQAIAIILTTSTGSVPLRPDFGADLWRYLDLPADQAAPPIIAKATRAINQWEPRVKVVRIVPSFDGSTLGLAIHWQDVNGGISGIAEVRL